MSDESNNASRDASSGDRKETGSVVTFPRERAARRPPHNLPQELSSFIGRGREVAEVERLLSGRRLLTLCGPGGCGKTRLALVVARNLVGAYEDGAWLVELAPLSDPDLVPRALAQALGARGAGPSAHRSARRVPGAEEYAPGAGQTASTWWRGAPRSPMRCSGPALT